MIKLRLLGAVCAGFLMLGHQSTNAAVIQTSTINVVDPSSLGQIQVTSTVTDNYLGDFTKWTFDYEIFNISYDPTPGVSNGLSGFNLVFGAPQPSTADQYAPAGWIFNCCGTTPPFGTEYDIPNSNGFGISIGNTGNVGFTTNAGVLLTSQDFGSWAHSWEGDIQTNTFNLQDVASGVGPIVPGVPIPAAVWLFGSGLLGLIGVARRKKAA
jgi:hypothetical protein